MKKNKKRSKAQQKKAINKVIKMWIKKEFGSDQKKNVIKKEFNKKCAKKTWGKGEKGQRKMWIFQ